MFSLFMFRVFSYKMIDFVQYRALLQSCQIAIVKVIIKSITAVVATEACRLSSRRTVRVSRNLINMIIDELSFP